MTATTESVVPDVYRAICQAAKAISHEGISKDKKNEQQGYKFRGIDDIYNALSAILAGAELCILPRMTSREQQERTTQKGGVLFYVTIEAEFDFVSARDGSKHTVKMYGEAMDSADKATNKAMSAAYKYACMQVFCIPTEGMDDADSVTPAVAAEAKLAGMKKAKAEGRSVVTAEPIYEPPEMAPMPTLHDDIVNFPEKDTKATRGKPYDKFAMYKAMGKLKDRFVAIGKESEYRRILGIYGATKRDELPTHDGGISARMAFKEMSLLVQDLEVAAAIAADKPKDLAEILNEAFEQGRSSRSVPRDCGGQT